MDLWQATVQQIAEFLHHLYQQGKLRVCTIDGFKSAVVASLKSRAKSVGKDPYLCGLINSFYTDRPVELNLVPRWDLSVVLNTLTKSPLEPHDMSSIEVKFLILRQFSFLLWHQGQEEGKYTLPLDGHLIARTSF